MRRKLKLFGHIMRMDDSRKIKGIMLGIMEGTNKRGRPCREWLDDVVDGCHEDIFLLSRMAQDRKKWNRMVKLALDTYGQSARGLMMMMMILSFLLSVFLTS